MTKPLLTKMRVRIVGHFGEGALALYVRRGFESLGASVDCVPDTDLTPSSGLVRRIRERLPPIASQSAFTSLQHDCSLTVVVKSPYLAVGSLDRLKQMTSGPVVNWMPDDPFLALRPAAPWRLLRRYDAIVTYSVRVNDRLRAKGHKAVLVPFGFDPDDHLVSEEASPDVDFVFVGQASGYRARVVRTLLQGDLTGRVFGDGWDRFPEVAAIWESRRVFGARASREYLRGRFGLNVLHLANNQGSHNMRTFELPAIGVPMLTTSTEQQRDLLSGLSGVAYYDESLCNIVDRARSLLATESQGRLPNADFLAANSYAVRASRLMEQLNLC